MGEPFGLSREEVISMLHQHVQTDVLIKHCLATEAIMRSLAVRLNEDPEVWALVGLAHDLDYEETKDIPEKHTLVTADILANKGVPEEYRKAIISHNEAAPGSQRQTSLDYALTAAENITGLIVAAALVVPDKKLASVKPRSILKRMKEKAFARKVDREAIKLCQQIGIPLEEFVELSLKAMQSISDELGL